MFRHIGQGSTSQSSTDGSVHCRLSLTLSLLVLTTLVLTTGDPNALGSAQEGSGTSSGSKEQIDKGELKPGTPIEQEIIGSEIHSYRVAVTSGQFLRVIVDQRGIDLTITAFGPDGQKLNQFDGRWNGPESVSLIAEVSGSLRLEVSSLLKIGNSARYEIRIAELREGAPQDKSWFMAEKASSEAKRLVEPRTAESFRKAMLECQGALLLWRAVNDRSGEAQTLNTIGFIHNALGENQKALEYYGQALLLRQVIGDRYGEAETLHNIGAVYSHLGEKQRAVSHYKQVLNLRREIDDLPGQAVTLNNLGSVHATLGENEKSLEYYTPALEFVRSLGDRLGEIGILTNMGTSYSLIGEHQQALNCFLEALAVSRAIGDQRFEPYTLIQLGNTYAELGENQKAIDYYGRALPLSKSLGDPRLEANTLTNLGARYHMLGDKEEALKYYNDALRLWRAVKDRRGEAYTLSSFGKIYDELGEKQRALEYYGQALSLTQALGDRRAEAVTLNNRGFLYASLREEQKAAKDLNEALQLWQAVADRNGEATTLLNIARAERDRGNFRAAQDYIEGGLSLIEELRIKIGSPELRASYFASKQNLYGFYLDLLMRMYQSQPSGGFDASALQASERARARSLLEILNEARADIRQGVDPQLLERERSLQQQINARAEHQTRLRSGKHTEEQAVTAKRDLQDLLTEYQEVQAQIRVTSPRYAALTQPHPLNLKEIQQMLDPDTLLLEYALGDDRSYLWVATPTSMASFELPKRAEIEAIARQVYDSLIARNQVVKGESSNQKSKRLAQAEVQYREAATSLNDMLLAPVATQLEKKRLLVVADGALQYVPFGVLLKPAPALLEKKPIGTAGNGLMPLFVDHEIVSLPSASTLAVLRREVAGRPSGSKLVAVLADPVFEPDDSRVKRNGRKAVEDTNNQNIRSDDGSIREEDVIRSARDTGITDVEQRIRRLPFSRKEAEAIITLVPERAAMMALDFAANREAATSTELGQYRIVHFATHGLLNSVHPELSGIVLSLVDRQGQSQDGFLRLHDVYNLKLSADLVVLSACQTGLGKEISGEGLIGLTRGFMYAGAARVLASLWKVDDEATAEFMRHFYKGILGKSRLSPAAALRAAQLAMRKDIRWRSPYYWASFILQGEWK